MVYLQLMFEFFKTGLFTVGGGLATLPFLRDISTRLGWFTQEELINMIAISESTPGPIGINMATYAGFKAGNILGAIVASLALIVAPMIIIMVIAKFLDKFKENKIVQSVFYGIRPAVCGLITAAGYQVIVISLFSAAAFEQSGAVMDLFNIKAIILYGVLLWGVMKLKKHPALYIAAAALIGILIPF